VCKKPSCQPWRFPYPEYSAYLRRFKRADERTRTADLLITSWLAALLMRTIVYQYVAYRRRIFGRSGASCPIAYRPVPARLQYCYSTFSNL
jgi:hypothetical protein